MNNNDNIINQYFLEKLLLTQSPSGQENQVFEVLEEYVKPYTSIFKKDIIGNCISGLNTENNKNKKIKIMLSGHMDELGFIIKYIDNKGFLYIDTVGGHDKTIIPGRNVTILSSKQSNKIKGIIGKKAIHLQKNDNKTNKFWIDIGVQDYKEAIKKVSVGDYAVYTNNFSYLTDNIIEGRALDNKIGCYIVNQVLILLSQELNLINNISLFSVSSAQEEIGIRGAITSSFSINPNIAIAVDVTHATDIPDSDVTKDGEIFIGKGPVLLKSPNVNNELFYSLIECAKQNDIPYQIEAESRTASNDAYGIQISKEGIYTLVISIPLRYMHTPTEIVDLNDVKNAIKLIKYFCLSFNNQEYNKLFLF